MSDLAKKFMEHAAKDENGNMAISFNGTTIASAVTHDGPRFLRCSDIEKAIGVRSKTWVKYSRPGELSRMKVDAGHYYAWAMCVSLPCVERTLESLRMDEEGRWVDSVGAREESRFIPDSEWEPRPIQGHDGYFASSNGAIWSDKSGKLCQMSQRINKDGYFVVGMTVGGKKTKHLVHRLVLMAFVGPPEPHQETLHGNGVKTDNRLSNLRWGTSCENSMDAKRHRAERISGN